MWADGHKVLIQRPYAALMAPRSRRDNDIADYRASILIIKVYLAYGRELFTITSLLIYTKQTKMLSSLLYRKRQEIVEHVFGTIKAVWGYKQFLCRTLAKVAAETALTCLAYNMRRAFNIYKGDGLKLTMV